MSFKVGDRVIMDFSKSGSSEMLEYNGPGIITEVDSGPTTHSYKYTVDCDKYKAIFCKEIELTLNNDNLIKSYFGISEE